MVQAQLWEAGKEEVGGQDQGNERACPAIPVMQQNQLGWMSCFTLLLD